MYCSNCGAKIDDNARFCPECGKSMSSSQPRVPEYTPEPTSTRRKNTSFKKPQFKKEGSGEGSKVFFKILAAAIVVLVAYLGYDYFANGVGGGDEVVKKTSKPYFHLNEEDKDTNQASSTGTKASGSFNFTREELADLSPSSPSLIGIHMTRSEIESVAPITAKVSPENPTCQVGGITVKFNSFDLDEEDTFQLRQLGTRQDQATGSELTLYDFSLASGKHEFSGDVAITIPRSQDGRDNGIYYYNENKKVWESTSYDISGDGKNYILYTNHFTPYSKRCWMASVSSEEYNEIYESIRRKEEFIRLRQGFYFIEDPQNYRGKDLLKAPLWINRDLFHVFMEPSSNEQVKLSKYLTDSDVEQMELDEAMSLWLCLPDLSFIYNTAGNANTISTFMLDFKDYVKDLNNVLGKALQGAGMVSLWNKIVRICGSDEDNLLKILNLINEGHGDIMTIAGVSGNLGWAVAAYTILYNVLVNSLDHFVPEGSFETQYHFFMEKGFVQSGIELNCNGKGWQELITKVVDEEVANHGSLNSIDARISEEIQKFVGYYWEASKEERDKSFSEYFQKLQSGAYHDLSGKVEYAALVKDAKKINYYKERASERVKAQAASAIGSALKTIPSKISEQLIDRFNSDIMPYKNTVLRFIVENDKLLTNGTFDKSPYAKGKIHFDGLSDIIMYPGRTHQSSYPKELFTPEPKADSNEIFICRRYAYEMYGMPKTITFEGTEGMKPITLKVEIPKKVDHFVEVKLVDENEVVDLAPFLGDWEVKLDEGTENETTEIISLKESKDKKYIEISSRRKKEKCEYSYDSKSGRLKSSGKECWLEKGNLHAIVDGKSYILHRPKKKKVVCPDCGGEDGKHSPDCISPFNVRIINL